MPLSTICLTSNGGDGRAVRPREPDDPPDGVLGELLPDDAAVGPHMTPDRTHGGSHRHVLTSSRSLSKQGRQLTEPSHLRLALGEPLRVQVE
jgi:hypothetical protein